MAKEVADIVAFTAEDEYIEVHNAGEVPTSTLSVTSTKLIKSDFVW